LHLRILSHTEDCRRHVAQFHVRNNTEEVLNKAVLSASVRKMDVSGNVSHAGAVSKFLPSPDGRPLVLSSISLNLYCAGGK